MPEHSNKLFLSIDSQWLEEIQSCHRRMKFRFIDNLRPLKKAEALEKGSLLHEMLDQFYTNWELDYSSRIEKAIEHAKQYMISLSLPIQDCNEVIFQFREYCDHYKMDGWRPLLSPDGKPLVEQTFSVVLSETDEHKILYSGKIDLIATTPVGEIIVDHKSESRKSDPSMLTNQFVGYAFALQIHNVWINKIGFQKTLSRSDRFRRILIAYNKSWIEEWRHNIIPDILRAAEVIKSGDYRPNFTACHRGFFGCTYSTLCETTEDNREFKARTFFEVGEAWDPYTAAAKREG